jgi:hypothetical protein
LPGPAYEAGPGFFMDNAAAMGRKLSVGETLSEVFAIYREHAGVLLPLAFWLYLVVAIVDGIEDRGELGVLFVIGLMLGFVVALLYQGMVVSLVRDVQDGRRDSSVGDLYRSVLPVLAPLLLASLLYGIAVAVGFVLLVVPGCILLTIWAVIAPAIVIEHRGVSAAFGRSRELVRGNGWPVFGVVIAAILIAFVASAILGSIAEAIAGGPILRIVFSALAATVTAPIPALAAGVLYYRLLEIKSEVASAEPNAYGEGYTPPAPPPGGPTAST